MEFHWHKVFAASVISGGGFAVVLRSSLHTRSLEDVVVHRRVNSTRRYHLAPAQASERFTLGAILLGKIRWMAETQLPNRYVLRLIIK